MPGVRRGDRRRHGRHRRRILRVGRALAAHAAVAHPAKEALGLELTLKQLFVRPTVAQLLRDQPATADLLGPLIRLRGGTGRPLWCIHPGSGLGWSYAGLLPYIPARHPCTPSSARPRRVHHPGRQFPRARRDYCARIVDIQPNGPYLLAGWSSRSRGPCRRGPTARVGACGRSARRHRRLAGGVRTDRDTEEPSDVRLVAFDGGEAMAALDEDRWPRCCGPPATTSASCRIRGSSRVLRRLAAALRGPPGGRGTQAGNGGGPASAGTSRWCRWTASTCG